MRLFCSVFREIFRILLIFRVVFTLRVENFSPLTEGRYLGRVPASAQLDPGDQVRAVSSWVGLCWVGGDFSSEVQLGQREALNLIVVRQ